MEVHQIDAGPAAGRWIRAQWDERGAQWTSSDLRPSHAFQGYRYTYARTLAGLAGEGIRTYATEQAARGEPEGEGDDASAAEECDRCGKGGPIAALPVINIKVQEPAGPVQQG